MDPLAATMNHSCNPNAVVSFDGPTLQVRSLRAIGVDEEILIAYVDVTDNPWHRQDELRERYFFTCTCIDCKEGKVLGSSAVPPNEGRFREAEREARTLLESAKSESDSDTSRKRLEQGMELMRDCKTCPVFRQPYAALRQQLAVNLISAQQWVPAFAQSLRIYFDIDPVLFPEPFHPVRITHKWTLAMLVLQIASLSVGEPGLVIELEEYRLDYGTVIWGLLIEVEGNVDRSHGQNTRFAKLVRRKMDQVKVDMTRGDSAAPKLGKAETEKQWALLRKVANELAP